MTTGIAGGHDYYKDSKDINVSLKKKGICSSSCKKDRLKNNLESGKSKRFFLNTGSMDDLRKGAVIRTICSRAKISSENIGPIEIMREFSFFEVETSVADKVLKSMKGAKIDGRNIRVQYAENKKPQTNRSKKSKKRNKS